MLDIVFEASRIVSAVLPPGVVALGKVLNDYMAKHKCLPPQLQADAALSALLHPTACANLGSLRATYMIKFLVQALGKRSTAAKADTQNNLAAGPALQKAFDQSHAKFLDMDMLCGHSDLGALSSAYGVAVSQVLEKGTFSMDDLSVKCDSTHQSDQAAASGPDAQGQDQHHGPSTVSLAELLECGCMPVKDESARTQLEAWFSSADSVHEVCLLLEQDMISHARTGRVLSGQLRAM